MSILYAATTDFRRGDGTVLAIATRRQKSSLGWNLHEQSLCSSANITCGMCSTPIHEDPSGLHLALSLAARASILSPERKDTEKSAKRKVPAPGFEPRSPAPLRCTPPSSRLWCVTNYTTPAACMLEGMKSLPANSRYPQFQEEAVRD